MKVLIVRAMRGEFPSMDVYADGLAAGMREKFPDWQIEEIEPLLLRNAGIRSFVHRAIVGVFRYVDRFIVFPLRVLSRKSDIAHIVSDHYFYIARLPRPRGQTIVATCHDLTYYRFPSNLKQFAKFHSISHRTQDFCMRSLRFADFVVTLSEDNVRDLQEILSVERKKMAIIHNAVPSHFQPGTEQGRSEARKAFGLPEDRFCMMHVGTVDPRKNNDTILKALAELRDLGVIFVKVGNDFTEVQNAIIEEHDLSPQIRHLGSMKNTELLKVYYAVDALIFPSLYEGFPFPVVEAMACDVPVITSTASSLPETAGGAAILVEPFDPKAIAEAVRALIQKEGFKDELIKKGRARIRLLTWQENAKAVGQIYQSLVSAESYS